MAPGLVSSVALALALGAFVLGSLRLVVALSEDEPLENLRFVRPAQDAPLVSHYNYIVIGGGTAGCPLAATLSEHSRVLLLERGGLPYRNMSNQQHFTDALADTSLASPAQRFISEDGVVNARARVLGGGSCLNAGFYTRASNDYVRAAGWDARLVNSSYRWVERALVFRPDVPPWQAALRDALLEAGVTPDNGFTFDHVTGTKIGGTIFDNSGQRHTAADFLRHARPRGLTVLLYATVSRILFRQQGNRPVLIAAGGVRRGVHGPAGGAAPGVPPRRRQERGDPVGGDAGEPAAADAERRRPAGAPGGARHPGAGGPAHGRAGRGRQPHELRLHPVARARRALARAGRRHHPLRQLHRGRQRLRVRHARLRGRPPPSPQLRPVLSADGAARHAAAEAEDARGSAARGGGDAAAGQARLPGRLHPGEDPGPGVVGTHRAALRRPARQPGGDVQLLPGGGGPGAVRARHPDHRAGDPVQGLRKLHLRQRIRGVHLHRLRQLPRQPAAAPRQRLPDARAVLQGHRHDHLALPRRLPGRRRRRRRLQGLRRAAAEGDRQLHLQVLPWHQPAGHRHDAREVYGHQNSG